MAISILNQSDNVFSNPGSSFSLTHTVSAGSNRVLVVLVGYENEDFEVINSVVWDAIGANETLTEIGTGHTTSDDATVHAFYLINPTAGASKLITVTLDASLNSAGASIVAFTLDGVDQGSPIRDENGDAQQGVTNLNATVTPIVSGDLLLFHANQENAAETPPTNLLDFSSSTFSFTLTQSNVTSQQTVFGSGYGTADSTSETLDCDSTDADHMAIQILAIAPDVGSSSSSSFSSSSLSSFSESSSSVSLSSSSVSLSSASSSSSCTLTAYYVSDTLYYEEGAITSAGFPFPVSGGKDKLLLVAIGWEQPATARTVISVTFDGIDLTLASASSCGGGCAGLEYWYLVNPPVKTANVEVIFSGIMDQEGVFINAINLQNVDQDNPIGNYASNSETNDTPTVSISGDSNSLLLASYYVDDMQRISVGSGQTEIAYGEVPSGVDGGSFATSYKRGTGSSTTMEWTLNDDSSDPWLITAIEINSNETLFVTSVRCFTEAEQMSIYLDYDLNTLEITRIWQSGQLDHRTIKVILTDSGIDGGLTKKWTIPAGSQLDEDLTGDGFEIIISDCEVELKAPFTLEVKTIL